MKKLGNIPDGGGWRFVGRAQGLKNRAITPGADRSKHRGVLMRHAFVHTVIDDHSRVAYAEIHDDETAATAIGVHAVSCHVLVLRLLAPVSEAANHEALGGANIAIVERRESTHAGLRTLAYNEM